MSERKRTTNPYRIEGNVAILSLTQGQETLIDVADLPRVLAYRWHADRSEAAQTYYVKATPGGKSVYLHRILLDAPKGLLVDHRDHDGLNNRRENLRLVTKSQNGENRTLAARRKSPVGVRGVGIQKWPRKDGEPRRMYVARVNQGGRSHVRYFPLTQEGLEEANEAAVQMRRTLMTHSDGR